MVAHNPETAEQLRTAHQERIKGLTEQAATWVGKLDSQEAGVKARGKKLSDSGAKARFDHAVKSLIATSRSPACASSPYLFHPGAE
jgi:hypothetical protein